MKKIVFVRHAKSSWDYNVRDIERPLKKRGIIDSGLVSNEFKTYRLVPDKVFSSPAKRAKNTCKIFIENLKIDDKNVHIVNELYDFSGANVVNFIKSLKDIYKNVMIFGHNNALTSMVNSYGNIYIDNLPTSGLVAIEFDIDNWNELKKGRTLITLFPRDLKV